MVYVRRRRAWDGMVLWDVRQERSSPSGDAILGPFSPGHAGCRRGGWHPVDKTPHSLRSPAMDKEGWSASNGQVWVSSVRSRRAAFTSDVPFTGGGTSQWRAVRTHRHGPVAVDGLEPVAVVYSDFRRCTRRRASGRAVCGSSGQTFSVAVLYAHLRWMSKPRPD